MQSNRRDILRLIAMGRMTPKEAERLIMAWNDGREMLWLLAAAVVFAAVSQIHWGGSFAGINRVLNELMSVSLTLLHSLVSTITRIAGGSL